MNCSEVEKLLHAYVDGEFDAPEVANIEGHLSACRDCAQQVSFERRLRADLRAKVQGATPAAPLHLRLKLQQGIRAENRRRRVQVSMRFALAAGVLVTVGGITTALLPRKLDRYVHDAAKRHARVLPHEIQAPAHEDVEAWFHGKLDHHVRVPRFGDAAIAGARLSNVQDRPAAYIRYEKADGQGTPRSLGLFVFGDENNDLGARPLPAAAVENRLGYNVAVWRDGEIVYELVSDLDEQDIRALLEAQLQRGAAVAP